MAKTNTLLILQFSKTIRIKNIYFVDLYNYSFYDFENLLNYAAVCFKDMHKDILINADLAVQKKT